jgi:amino acid transporter
VFLRRRDELKAASVVLAVVVVLALLYVFYKNVIPVPPTPYNLLPWVFLGALLLGLAWYLTVRVRTPEVADEIGSTEEEPVPSHGLHRDDGRDRTPDAGPTVDQT